MPTYYPSSILPVQFVDPDDGNLASGFTISAFLAGTTTPTNMFLNENGDSAGSVVTLNAAGYPEVSGSITTLWLELGVDYKFILEDAANNNQWTIDSIGTLSVDRTSDSYTDLAAMIADTPAPDRVRITSYHAGWAATVSGPKGGGDWFKTGNTAASPSEGSAVTGFETSGKIGGLGGSAYTGDVTQSGYAWDTSGTEWKLAFNERIGILQFGARFDNSTVDTNAWNNAIDFSERHAHVSINCPPDTSIIDDKITISGGVKIFGTGSQGSTNRYGTTIIHNSNGDLFEWDGGNAFAGTGGGLYHFLVLKGTGYSGGTGIKLLAQSSSNRPGEMEFVDCLVSRNGTGEWLRALHIDGLLANDSGSKGVRSVKLEKFRVSDCTSADSYILIDQAVHLFADYLQVDQGNTAAAPGITIQGDSANIQISNLNCNGSLNIAGSDNINGVKISGRCSTLNVTNSEVNGTYTGEIAASLVANNSYDFAVFYENELIIEKVSLSNADDAEFLAASRAGSQILSADSSVTGRVIKFTANATSSEMHFAVLDGADVEESLRIQPTRARPGNDNVMDLGASGARFSTVYAATGTINTSDEREKTFLDPTTDIEARVAQRIRDLIRKFQWNDSIERKGADGARIHYGVGAQEVAQAFRDEGLDPSRYAMFCYDEWERESHMVTVQNDDGTTSEQEVVTQEAGNRFGLRYDQLFAFIISAMW